MLVTESRRGRRLVGRLDRGAEIPKGLIEVCRAHGVRCAEVRATGALEQVMLGEFDQRSRVLKSPHRIDAPAELLNLTGTVSEREGQLELAAHVTISRERNSSIELLGGRLSSGRVYALDFVIEVFDDLSLQRTVDPQSGLPSWSEPPPPPVAEPEAPKKPAPSFESKARTAWSDVMQASAQMHTTNTQSRAPEAAPSTREEAPTMPGSAEAQVRPGDFIEHSKFGRCRVERVEGDQDFVSARMRNDRLIRLSLEVLALELIGNEDGHQILPRRAHRKVTGLVRSSA